MCKKEGCFLMVRHSSWATMQENVRKKYIEMKKKKIQLQFLQNLELYFRKKDAIPFSNFFLPVVCLLKR